MTPPDAAVASSTGTLAAPPVREAPPQGPERRTNSFRKYYKVFRVSLVERMTYRADFLLGTFLRFLPMLTTILLWDAIFRGSRQQSLSGFNFDQMIAYLLLVNITRMFSSMPGLAGGISRDIREGTLKKYLIQPIDMLSYLVSYRVAHKVTYVIASFVPYAVLFYLCRRFFHGNVPTDFWTWTAYLASLVLSFLIGFYFEASVGMVGFWFLEVTSILYIVMTLNFFLSGHMFPLDLLPPFWGGVLKALPFQYLAYFPAVVFLKKVTGWQLVLGLLAQTFWALFFVALSRWLYRRGLKRYSAFGG